MELLFPLPNSKRSREWRKEVIEGFNCYLRQINANKYNDYIITDTVFVITLLLKDEVILNLPVKRYFKHNNWQWKMLIPLCKIPVIDIVSIYWELLPSFITFILRVNYITGYMEKLKFGLIKRDFKSKQWVGGKIMIFHQKCYILIVMLIFKIIT